MTDALTLDELAVPLRALRLLALDFPHLPAPHVHLSTVFVERLELSLHDVARTGDSFAAFEAWRAALGIAPDTVTFHVQADGRTQVLRAECRFGGAEVGLIAYATAPQTAADRTGGTA
ncbi:hypothetical protein CLM62_02025 [Streptomyces sp. SA15]|uniref:hypothetical protein n=1 Tax=Streptomyces sp. SA15 TaxID=934019 RepID=UPI000BB0C8FB|nr:hypothetical protein [Streptomyces sp. SA15]PAZ17520.1 hypothetical protein CLM62_02025 [Streptomyces sp. SA15]